VGLPRRPGLLPDQGQAPTRVGKYAILPTTRQLDNGWYACSVAISSGQGRHASERVLRLTRLFRDSILAAEYALAEGLQWVGISRATPRLA
jgi:hypothetical protein